ncbi:MAG: hypothetical protein WDM86_17480 [Rhizomicrobium sp.]
MLGHDDGTHLIVWDDPDFVAGVMWTRSRDVCAWWFKPDGWRNDIQIKPVLAELGDDVLRYARSAQATLKLVAASDP